MVELITSDGIVDRFRVNSANTGTCRFHSNVGLGAVHDERGQQFGRPAGHARWGGRGRRDYRDAERRRWIVGFPFSGEFTADSSFKKGPTRTGAQRYRCHDCESIFNDLTATVFAGHQLTIPEMVHIIRGMEEHTTTESVQELDRTYKTVLDVVHDVQDALAEDPEFDLSGVCEADEVYVVAGEKGLEDADRSPRERGLSKTDAEPSSQTTHPS